MRPHFFSRLLGGLLGLSALTGMLPATVMADGIAVEERRGELVRLVRNDCGACHGLRLNGGLGPSLLPRSLQGKSQEALVEIILRGRAETAMPPWTSFMTEAEAKWIVEQLLIGFPDAH